MLQNHSVFAIHAFQSNAELAVRDMLRDFARRRKQLTGSLEVESEDFMDDGTPIRLRVLIDEKEVSRKNPPRHDANILRRTACKRGTQTRKSSD